MICEAWGCDNEVRRIRRGRGARLCGEHQGMTARERKMRLYLQAKNGPCTDCDNTFPPECMDFDHLPEFRKEFTISRSVTLAAVSEEMLMAEIAKCQLVCANCHRIRTKARRRSNGDKDYCDYLAGWEEYIV